MNATLAVCTAIYFLDGMIHTLLGPLAPEIARTLSLGNAELGPIMSSNLIGQCIGLVLFPPIASRFGHRIAVTLAVLGFAAGQACSALADSGGSLFALRLVTGIFLGGCLPSCLALVAAQSASARRGISILTLFTGYGLGAALAGAVAAGFAQHGGWRTAMVAVGMVSFAAAAAAWLWLRDTSAKEPAPAGQPAPMAVLQLLRPPYWLGTLMLWVLFVLMLTVSYCLNSWLPVMLVQVGFDESFAALSVTSFGFGGAFAALGVGWLIDRFGAMRVLIGFLAAAAIALFVTGQALEVASKTTLTILLAAAGFFSLGAYGGVNVVLAGFYPDALRATGIGWAKSIGRVGTVIAPILIGFALAAGASETRVMSIFAVPAILAAVTLGIIAMTRNWRARQGADAQRPQEVRTPRSPGSP